nr:hypothetical protein [uncultured Acetatifactor sp.]
MRETQKRVYVSERIINIAQLENLLREEQMLIGQMKKEVSVSEHFQTLLNQLEQVNKKAVKFEFCIERRKTRSQ